MSQNSGDLRVRRTQKLLRDALVSLIEEHSFDAITVGEIAERAMVSRAAFYRYYQDKYDLVERIFEEMLTKVNQDIDPLRHQAISQFDAQSSWVDLFGQIAGSETTPEPWVHMFEHFAQYERLYRALLGRRGSATFAARLRARIADGLSERVQALARALNITQIADSHVFMDGFVPAMIAAQLMDAVTWWLEHGRPYAPEQIATYCFRMMCSTLREVSAWE